MHNAANPHYCTCAICTDVKQSTDDLKAKVDKAPINHIRCVKCQAPLVGAIVGNENILICPTHGAGTERKPAANFIPKSANIPKYPTSPTRPLNKVRPSCFGSAPKIIDVEYVENGCEDCEFYSSCRAVPTRPLFKDHPTIKVTPEQMDLMSKAEKEYYRQPINPCYTDRTFDQPAERGDNCKLDQGKPMWDLLPLAALEPIVKVLGFAIDVKRYTPNSWKKTPNAKDRYYAALLRHLKAWQEGHHYDQESNMLHLAHAGCCIVFLLWFELLAYPTTSNKEKTDV